MLRAIVRTGLSIGLLAAFGVLHAQPARAESASLSIRVENVSERGGLLQVALYDEASYAGHDQPPIAKLSITAKAPVTVVTVPNIKPGVYAIKMFQDVHRTGSFAVNMLGIPEEPFGFSNDARPLFDQPGFDRAKFQLANGMTSIVIHLRSL